MGAVLAMKPILFCCGAAAFLAACGLMAEGTTAQKLTQLAVDRVSKGTPAPTAPSGSASMTRADIEASPVPIMFMIAQDLEGAAVVQLAAENGRRQTWASPDGITVTTLDGIITSTRGFAEDLFASDPENTLSVIRAGGGVSEKVVEFLDSNDHIQSITLRCEVSAIATLTLEIVEIAYETTRYKEHCIGGDLDHINYYWAEDDGNIVQTQQWMSFSVGYLVTQFL